MVSDKRVCLGCGKPVPKGMRERLCKAGWTFVQIEGTDGIEYYSNCGCMEWDRFIEAVEQERTVQHG